MLTRAIVLLLCLVFSGCASIIGAVTPEAQLEIAKREVSFRAVGMLGIDPMSGTIFCILCYITYSRNMPNPDPTRVGVTQ